MRKDRRIGMFILVFLIVAVFPITAQTSWNCEAYPSEVQFDNTDTFVQVADPQPIIVVEFDKAAESIHYDLYDEGGTALEVTQIYAASDKKEYRFTTPEQLAEGSYKFTVQGKDRLGNCGEYKEYDFTINIGTIGIELAHPKYGASKVPIFDLNITTDRDAEQCKYFSGGSFTFSEIQSPDNIFSVVDARNHMIDSFTATQQGIPVNVLCKDTYEYINNDEPRSFFLIYDPSPPNIDVSVFPKLVVEETKATISVRSDDEVVCKLDEEQVDFEDMSLSFPGFESKIFNSEKEYVKQPLTDADDKKTFKYYVQCMNRAEQLSAQRIVSFSVDRQAPDKIRAVGPTGVVGDTNVQIYALTNRAATCSYAGEVMNTFDEKNHTKDLSLSAEGTYNVNINCTFLLQGTQLSRQFSFIVDTSPPDMREVNSSNIQSIDAAYTCDRRMIGSWVANDTQSDIVRYNYTIYEVSELDIFDTSKLVMNWTTTNEDRVSVDISLQENKSYGFIVQAQNEAGLWSDPMADTVNTVIADSRYCPAYTGTCTDGLQNNGETDVDCGKVCDVQCETGQSCIVSDDCNSGFCDEGVCSTPYCDNGEFDEALGETDIDCGGTCDTKCEIDQSCKVNSDCSSGSCEDDVCVDATCNDGSMNGDETGVDCGGSCDACRSPTCQAGDSCVVACAIPDPDCNEDPGATCSVDGRCKLNCDPVDADCPATGPSCQAGDVCVANCEVRDPDCPEYFTCEEGDGCMLNCPEADPDCPLPIIPTCGPDDGCKQGCTPVDVDCDAHFCSGGNSCVAGCEVEDPDCGGASCQTGDGCMINCAVPDPDCNPNPIATCQDDRLCKWDCPIPDVDCSGASSCQSGDGCVAYCQPRDLDCPEYFTCEEGDGCMLGCTVPDPDCNEVVGHTCEEGDGCNPNCDPTDLDCGGISCNAGNVCVDNCAIRDPDCEGPACNSGADCVSQSCVDGVCVAPSCEDNRRNGLEADIDCGSVCAKQCSLGSSCETDFDCTTTYCASGTCEDFREKDSDNDGMPDYWEKEHFGCDDYVCADPDADFDEDGLSNVEEFNARTDPTVADTDNDGYNDGEEVNAGTDPLDPDSHPAPIWPRVLLRVFVLLLLIAIGVAVWKVMKQKKEEKMEATHPSVRPVVPSQQPNKVSLAAEKRRKEIHERYVEKMKKRAKGRLHLFEEFEDKKEEKKEKAKDEKKGTYVAVSSAEKKKKTPNLKGGGWIDLQKKVEQKKPSDVFESLEKKTKKLKKKKK